MVYQLNGKLGPFTLETDDDYIVLALLFAFAKDHSVYVNHPKIIDQNLDFVNFNIKIQEKFNANMQRYLEDNIDKIINVLKDYVPGYTADRIAYKHDVAEICSTTEMSADEQFVILKMLREAIDSNSEILTARVNQVLSIFNMIKLDMDNLTEAFAEHFLEPFEDGEESI